MVGYPPKDNRRFIGTREQCKDFLYRQPTQIGASYRVKCLLTGQQIHLT